MTWYELGTKHGIIAGWDARNKFHICKQKLLSLVRKVYKGK